MDLKAFDTHATVSEQVIRSMDYLSTRGESRKKGGRGGGQSLTKFDIF